VALPGRKYLREGDSVPADQRLDSWTIGKLSSFSPIR
jgi:hypothetical protein